MARITKHMARIAQPLPRNALVRRMVPLYLRRALTCAGRFLSDQSVSVATSLLSQRQLRAIVRKACDHAERRGLKSDKQFLHDCGETRENDAEIISDMYQNRRLKATIYREVMAALAERYPDNASPLVGGPLQKRLDEVATVFALDETEKEILLCLYLVGTNMDSRRILLDLCEASGLAKKEYQDHTPTPLPVSVMTALPRALVEKAFRKTATLMRWDLIDDDRELACEIVQYLQGYSDVPILNRYFQEYTGAAIPLEHHVVRSSDVQTVSTLHAHRSADRPLHVLLYGTPGTGKTEFARSLGKHLALKVYEIRMPLDGQQSTKEVIAFRHRAVAVCHKMIDVASSIVVVDEADSMLSAEGETYLSEAHTEKGQINQLMDKVKGLYLWIVNRSDGIDESTRRRFDYSIGFEQFTFAQRRAVWERSLQKHQLEGCIASKQLDRLTSAYEINAGGIDIALRNAADVHKGGTNDLVPIVDSILNAHQKFLDRRCVNASEAVQSDAPEYGLDGLNVAGGVSSALRTIERFNALWTPVNTTMPVRNMNVLLYGPPGTGKTEFAKYIARLTKRRLIVKKASDLLSMYVGESEKTIRRTFEEAERDRAILFIDEADSMFWRREGATHSWEVTQVNELLTSMESLKGMLICSTNFKTLIDSAAMRRFAIKLQFDYLKPEGNEVFYRRFMARLTDTPMQPDEVAALRNTAGLTPGDFKTVFQSHALSDPKSTTHRQLIDALRDEARMKNEGVGKRMGF